MNDSSPRLGRDVFLALAAVGWADGHLDQDEADAIVRTAIDEGLDLEAIAEIEEATKQPLDIGFIDRSNLTKEDRLFVYAVASWMVGLGGHPSENEQKALDKLGGALHIPERPRAHADALAREVAQMPDGDRPARYDLGKLRQIIGERLREARRLRAEAAPGSPPGETPTDAADKKADEPPPAGGSSLPSELRIERSWVPTCRARSGGYAGLLAGRRAQKSASCRATPSRIRRAVERRTRSGAVAGASSSAKTASAPFAAPGPTLTTTSPSRRSLSEKGAIGGTSRMPTSASTAPTSGSRDVSPTARASTSSKPAAPSTPAMAAPSAASDPPP